ncbi:OmpH family outer membrane protein [Acinetobacter wuhouensis]|uniref:OmpH family outer membrane protein n=1 Tax=Acinetobacter wuhouensis TaxID=1879050 RepID=A0A385C3J5_9GAMM|nr:MULTISPECIES: OmpH family outer membrane protein [Acinetobacter]AXQ22239.1 OmpH family outer membrane protein [Acinetobacter wuhouensis]AYO54543.1 OmpH family outer membrane protein [Acinetobacter wuhouensis]RZG48723.1 OmpH family outer membrane protein [Acinetobacter wuhouensis]RZG72967.1 OmpH family outer membrane protein [Acinetobacter wuhouensis]RZG75069.1 OmpH family outer membrane protein [Acinetobacter sp. WCHAc060025]
MKTMKMAVLGLGLGFAGLVQAAGFGVVDLEKVVESSTYLKQQNASLEQSVKPQTTKLEQITKDIEALKQKAQAQGANVQQINAQYQAKVNEFQTIQQGVQTKVQTTIQNTNATFETRVKQAAEQLRQEAGLDFVLNKNSALAYDAKNDLTAKMIQKVNAIK